MKLLACLVQWICVFLEMNKITMVRNSTQHLLINLIRTLFSKSDNKVRAQELSILLLVLYLWAGWKQEIYIAAFNIKWNLSCIQNHWSGW